MAARKLTANVWVNGELYAAGAAPEKAVADLIENPKAWAEVDEAPADEVEGSAPDDEAPARRARR